MKISILMLFLLFLSSVSLFSQSDKLKEIKNLIEEDVEYNFELIQEKVSDMSKESRQELYSEYEQSGSEYMYSNMVPLLGLGSWSQGDYADAVFIMGGQIVGFLYIIKSFQRQNSYGGEDRITTVAACFLVGCYVWGYICPYITAYTRNSTLEDALLINDDISLNIQPSVIKIQDNYGPGISVSVSF
jgi:hypothetical protein